jgi:localization factor PodJL
MAAEGAWPQDGEMPALSFDAQRTRAAVGQLRELLGALEARLAADGAQSLTPRAASELAAALHAFAQRLDARPTATPPLHALEAGFEAKLVASEARILARLDRLERATAGREPRLVGGVLMAASAAALLSVAGAAGWILAQSAAAPDGVSSALSVLAELPFRKHLTPEKPAPAEVRAALKPLPPLRPPPSRSASDDYAAVIRDLDRGDASALPRLTGLAEGGNAQAQLHLASFYEAGSNGLPRDVPAARQWTRKAAEGGDRIAMHNLALYLAQGEGGPRDVGEAAQWFRRAAEQGVVDSQYNLALLYEAGRGVDRNLREAYRWFAVAANAGDAVSREKVVELEAKLKAAERGGLDQDVKSFAPGAAVASEPGLVIAPATTVAETQAMLARLGYYVGPADGAATPAYKAAVAAYQRDQPVRTN